MSIVSSFIKIGVLSVALCACSNETKKAVVPLPTVDNTTLVTTEQGEVVGFRGIQNAKTWLGISFAKPPVGAKRWQPPQAPASRNEVYQALKHAPRCSQLSNRLDQFDGIEFGTLVGSEDCLYLDVYAPQSASSDKPLPVMVWIHGGSNVWGGADQYDGSDLAASGEVIVVVPQYRLGPLGWLAHPALINESDYAGSNFGLMDLQLAVKWIKNNIQAFGGDANNITVFGESAGAYNTFSLLAMRDSEPLFNKAIAQSGGPQTHTMEEAIHGPLGSVTKLNPIFSAQKPTAEQLKALSTDKVLKAFFGPSGVRVISQIGDGITLSKEGIFHGIQQNYQASSLTMIIGANRDEMKFYTAFNDEFVWRLFGKIPIVRDDDLYDAVSEYSNKYWFKSAVIDSALELEKHGVESYLYRFDWDELPSSWGIDLSKLIGAAHTVEVPFIFNSFDNHLGRFGEMLFTDDNVSSRTLLKDAMQQAWINFAYSGDPNPEDKSETWNKFRHANQFVMQFDASKQLMNGKLNDEFPALEGQLTLLQSDARVENSDGKCKVFTEVNKLSGFLLNAKKSASGCPF